MNPVHIIGGGLAGSEAAWQLARAGVPCVLHEMRPVRRTEAHVGAGLAELVCSNSFRSDDAERNAVGLLHEEMRRCGSLILAAADRHKVPAGGALAVDRVGFSEAVESGADSRPAGRDPPRGDRRAAAAGMGRGHHRHRPADLSVSRRGADGADRRGEPRLFRRDRADRLSRHDRFRRGVVPVALRQGRGRRLHQLPARPRAIRGVCRGAAGRREDRVPRMGEIDAVFRRLPAGRDHGGARSRTRCAGGR